MLNILRLLFFPSSSMFFQFILFFFVRLLPFLYWRYNINSLLTIGGWWIFFWPAKIHSVISLTLCGLLDSETHLVKSSNFHEMLSLIHSFVGAKEYSPAPWVSFSLSYQNQSLRFFWLFVCPIFTSSESELYSEEVSSSETLV